jgi:hypothetical protein
LAELPPLPTAPPVPLVPPVLVVVPPEPDPPLPDDPPVFVVLPPLPGLPPVPDEFPDPHPAENIPNAIAIAKKDWTFIERLLPNGELFGVEAEAGYRRNPAVLIAQRLGSLSRQPRNWYRARCCSGVDH